MPRPEPRTPEALDGMPPRFIAAFERDYRAATRRERCSREDFAAGYATAYRAYFGKHRTRKPVIDPSTPALSGN